MIKGGFLFLAFSLLLWMILLAFEYLFWLDTSFRLVLVVVALSGTVYLLVRYLGIPLIYLFRLRNGLSMKKAASIIGEHFPEVGDRLVNLLDLVSDRRKSELLMASIEQRSRALSPVPFHQAIDLRRSFRYARFAAIPVLLAAGLWISGQAGEFLNSLDRLVHYDVAYERPAPFRFVILNTKLQTIAKQDYTLHVMTEGNVQPDEARIVIDGRERLMHNENGQYGYTFSSPGSSQEFYLTANDVKSKKYVLETVLPPAIQEFYTVLDYPAYTGQTTDTLRGTGNAQVPEGTKVGWLIKAENTEDIKQYLNDTVISFQKKMDNFELYTTLKNDISYEIATSNNIIRDYERLAYSIAVIKDASPLISVNEIRDTLANTLSYAGVAKDDYEVSRIGLWYYEEGKEDQKHKVELARPGEKEYSFIYDFPTGLTLIKGKAYNYYFEVTDNDGLHKGKVSQSKTFTTDILDEEQELNRRLEEQREVIRDWERSMDGIKEQEEQLRELERNQKEKSVLDYNDQKSIRDFLRSQKQQETLMEKFSKKLQETMGDFRKDSQEDRLLKERLERQEMEARKNERLLEELQHLADKIDKDEMANKLEEVAKRQQNSKRNLSQLVELTKRYYVTEKASEIARALDKLANKQDKLADTIFKKEEIRPDQKRISKEFKKISEDLDELRKANEELQKPLPMDTGKEEERDIKNDLDDIEEDLDSEDKQQGDKEDQAQNSVKRKQKLAANKMKKMGQGLQQSAMSGSASTMAEDAEMLRRILENLIVFSLKQESLFEKLNQEGGERNYAVSVVREQQQLRSLFEHVDDSLFALSLRQAEITEFVNEQITEVFYNIDSSLENLAEGQVYRAGAHQQSVLTSANNLADFLANVLGNMQESLAQGKGSGKSQDGFQLPDIIKGQEDIEKSMSEMGKDNKGKDGKDGEGNGKSEGERGGDDKGRNQGDGMEDEMEQLFEIYKQQQMIRAKLENQLSNLMRNEDRELAERLARQMEDFERDLIENGITKRSLDKVNRIKQQLMRLENAALEQGNREERESNIYDKRFERPVIRSKESVLRDRGVMEILQRQALPLREFYGERAKRYFWKND